jgi:molybdate transport system permease protein
LDWTALLLSLRLAAWTVVILLPVSVFLGRFLAYREFPGKGLTEALVAIPLVLPPTVFGYYLLVSFGARSPFGQFWQVTFGHQLVFTFEGLLVASVIFNLPFAVQPTQRGFEAIPVEVREAGACSDCRRCGLSGRWSCRWPGRG